MKKNSLNLTERELQVLNGVFKARGMDIVFNDDTQEMMILKGGRLIKIYPYDFLREIFPRENSA